MGDEIIGIHPVYEALQSGSRSIDRIYVARESRSPKLDRISKLARRQGIPVRRDARTALDRLVPGGQRHQGVVAIAGIVAYRPLEELIEVSDGPLVILDEAQDPQNLGAVIRSAEAAGSSGLILSDRRTAPLSTAVARASAGAVDHLPIARVPNLVSAIKCIKQRGIWVVGVDPSAETTWTEFDFRVPVALVLGAEHSGIRRLVRETCDVLIRFPMLGRIESLNLSVAAGLVLYEVVRQRRSWEGNNLA